MKKYIIIKADYNDADYDSQKTEISEENNLKEFDETDFKVYSVLEALENEGLTKVQRAQAIAKLVKE